MVQEVSAAEVSAYGLRIADYLRACGLPAVLIETWRAQILAAADTDTDLTELLRIAQQRMDAWLAESLRVAADDRHALLNARAALPYWEDANNPLSESARAALRTCCHEPVPRPAALEMPIQVIPLRSLGGLVDTACQECLPFSRRVGRRFYGWLQRL